MARVVLASASPRRRDLLRAAGLDFEVRAVEVDETLEVFRDHREAALALAERKGRAALAALEPGAEPRWLLAADTVVAVERPGGGPDERGWRLLGKPADEGEARGMLELLSGSRHAVTTGIFAARAHGGRSVERSEAETTWVRMRALSQGEVLAYVRSGEWRDKAGGYAIQESADAFVTGLEGGGFDNVVGLPVALALRLLRELGAP